MPSNPFKVGDRVHYRIGSDVRPGTVVKVSNTRVHVRDDDARLVKPNSEVSPGGFAAHFSNDAEWECFENPNGGITKFGLRKNGAFIKCGATHRGASELCPGWHYFYDYNF